MTPNQVAAARQALGWSQDYLAKRAGVSRSTLSRFELGYGTTVSSRTQIDAAFEGVEIPLSTPNGPPIDLPPGVTFTPRQARAARQMLNLGPVTICRAIAIARATLDKAEDVRKGPITPLLARRLRAYYEAAGVVFTTGEPGVKLRAKGEDLSISAQDH